MEMNRSFTKGPILRVLLKYALPVLAVLFLQALYGEVDLLVVGQFGTAADVSAVATFSQLLQLVTFVTTGLAMGITISIGHAVGCPYIGRSFDENWNLDDPTGKSDEAFISVIREIEERVLQLKQQLAEELQA